MPITQSLTVTQVAQSVANNTSTIRILWTTTQSGAAYNNYAQTGYYYVSVNGGTETKYTVSTYFPKQSTKTIVDTTLVVKHNSNGECTVNVRSYIDTAVSIGVIQKSASLTLDTIHQASTLSASDGTLGVAQTLSITRYDSGFTHSIRYDCGTASVAVCTKVSDTSISFTPPLNLAKQNTTGATVQIKFTLYTFDGDTEIGTTTKTINCTIPASVKPSCTIAVTDTEGYEARYGKPIKGLSKLKVTITPTLGQDAPIIAYTSTANGSRYNVAEYTTDVLKSSGAMEIYAAVTDSRNRSGTATVTKDVYDYNPPTISSLTVHRCDADGTENGEGEYVQVAFAATVSDSFSNYASYEMRWKKASDTEYTNSVWHELEGTIGSVSGTFEPFEADTGSAYDVVLVVYDDFTETQKSTSVSTAETIMHFRADGTGICFGGVSTMTNSYEFRKSMYDKFGALIGNGLAAYAGGGDAGIDPDTTLEGLCLTSHTNAPQGLGTFYFICTSFYNTKAENAARAQIAFPYKKTGAMYHRYYASGAWSAWERYITASDILDMVYPVGSYYISHTNTSPASLFGGTWHRIEGRFLWAAPSTSTLGLTAGEQTHTLTEDEMPTHNHDGLMYTHSSGAEYYVSLNAGSSGYKLSWGGLGTGAGRADMHTVEAGGGAAHNNMPPYVNVAIWRRTA